jgi:hypothetical protein
MVYTCKIKGTLTTCVQVQFGKKSALVSDNITPGVYCSSYEASGKKRVKISWNGWHNAEV